MPCLNHDHRPWPKTGKHRILIEACETHCGWCDYSTGQANNLRVHARRHIANLTDDTLRDITIVAGKAGRSRVALRFGRARLPRANTESGSPPATPDRHQSPAPSKSHEPEYPEDIMTERTLLIKRILELEGVLFKHNIQSPTPDTKLLENCYQNYPHPWPSILPRQLSPPPWVGYTGPRKKQSDGRKRPNLRISTLPETLSSSDLQRPQQNQDFVRIYQSGISKTVARDKNDTQTRFPSMLLQEPRDYFDDVRRHLDSEPNPFETSFAPENTAPTSDAADGARAVSNALTLPERISNIRALQSGPLSPVMSPVMLPGGGSSGYF